MASSYTSTCYLLDISPSMGQPLYNPSNGLTKTRLEWAILFVQTKLAQRLINPKTTDQIALVTFGGEQTDNAIAAGGDKDGYEHIQEILSLRPPTLDDLHAVGRIALGSENVDIIAAIYVAGNLMRMTPAKFKKTRKSVILITDADEKKGEVGKVLTDWEDEDWINPLVEGIVPGLNGAVGDPRDYFTLGVIGTDFGDGAQQEAEKEWSEQKRTNVAGITSLVSRITQASSRISPTSALAGPHARFGCLSSALEGASAPSIAPIKTTNKSVSLRLGDPDSDPGQSLDVRVCLQKAVQKAATQSMGKMRRGAWNKSLRDDTKNGSPDRKKGRKRRGGAGSDEAEEAGSGSEEDEGVYRAPGEIVNERVYYYAYRPEPPSDKKADNNGAGGGTSSDSDSSSADEATKALRSEEARRLKTTDHLSKAYKYGADLVPINKEEEEEFYQFPAGTTGLQIKGFVKASAFHPEWILNDPYYIWADHGQENHLQLSALLWGLKTTGHHALARVLVPAQRPQPRMCLLIPRVGEEAIKEGVEMGVLVQLPFKEDVANWSFPSLDRIHTTTGQEVTEHRLLPKKQLLNAMDDFVDAMMLPTYEVEQPDQSMDGGEVLAPYTESWFNPEYSYSPAIHNMRNAVISKILESQCPKDSTHPGSTGGGEDEDVVPESISRYMLLPPEIEEGAREAAEVLKSAADLKKVPPKPKAPANKAARKRLGQKQTTSALEDILGPSASVSPVSQRTSGRQSGRDAAAESQYEAEASQSMYRRSGMGRGQGQSSQIAASQRDAVHSTSASSPGTGTSGKKSKTSAKGKKKATDDESQNDSATEGSETEVSGDDNEVVQGGSPSASGSEVGQKASGKGKKAERALGIISKETPLQDFEKNLAQEGMISTALEGMALVIPQLVEDALAEGAGKTIKPLKCLVRFRAACFEEDEVAQYNGLMTELKKQLKNDHPSSEDFFARLKTQKLGPITRKEAHASVVEQQRKFGIDESVEVDDVEGVTDAEEKEFWKNR